MGIGGVTSTSSMSNMQTLKAISTDPKIKKIQNDITNAKQQMQKLSPKEELSAIEKETERKKLQQEISSLNTKLKQHQEELSKSQQKEIRMAGLQEDQNLTKEEKPEAKTQTKGIFLDKADEKALPTGKHQTASPGTVITSNSDGTVIFKGKMNQDEKRGVDTEEKGIAEKKVYSIVSADSSVQQASRQGHIITSTRDGIAILKSEMNQDEKRGVDTERKQAELEKMEKREQRAIVFQSAILGEANNTMKSAAKINVTGMNDKAQVTAKNNAFFNALRVSQEETQAAGQGFHISFA